ncbi:hypothetical protein SJAV_08750 [Sulfurisphaera javensis]|uniref:Uncharacterized protein n=1 Tax=Sulfurisphaera javensis TaxID=2049879 RepID=A0AAT9GPT9_9CREN
MSLSNIKMSTKLVKKVGKYYIEYKNKVPNVDKLLKTGYQSELPIDEITKAFLLLSLFKESISKLLKLYEEAEKEKLKHRQFAVKIDSVPYGPIDIPRTILLRGKSAYAYYSFEEGTNAPEYAILLYLLDKAYNIISFTESKLGKEIQKIDIRYFRNKFEKTVNKIKKLENIIRKLRIQVKNEFFRPITHRDPDWLISAYEEYLKIKRISEIEIGIGSEKLKIEYKKQILLLLRWRLYEIYTFFLVAKLLESKGYTIVFDKGEFLAYKGGKKLRLLFNSSIESKSKLDGIDDLSDVTQYMGRPDFSLDNSNLIIFECKYSSRVSYITASRFKIMAYAYEYDPLTVILVYPGLIENEAMDLEEMSTLKLNEIVNERGYVDIRFKNGKKLFMLKINPLDDDNKNIKKIENILSSLNMQV